MNIELLDFEKNVTVNYKVGDKLYTSNLDDYNITELSKDALTVDFHSYQISYIDQKLAWLMSVYQDEYGIKDNVNKPSHYSVLPGVEVIDIRKALLNKIPTDISFEAVDHWSRAWEYLTRMWGKNGLEDAKKAQVYLTWLIDKLELDKRE